MSDLVSVVAADKEVKRKCADCLIEFDVTSMQAKGLKALICNPCNSVKSRLQRLDCGLKFSLKDMTSEERHEFNKKAHNMYGRDLNKLVTDSVLCSSIRKQTTQMSQEGELEPMRVLEERYKDLPEAWQNIVANAHRVIHPVSKEVYLWMPKLSISMTDVEEMAETRKRGVEIEMDLKGKKQPKVSKKNAEIKAEEAGTEEKPTPLSESMQTKLQAQLEKMQTCMLKLEECELEIQKPESAELISPALAKKHAALKEQLAMGTKAMEETLAKGQVVKGETKQLQAQLKESQTQAKDVAKRIKAAIEAGA
eukprot:12422485-Karenia_brevis.AAC.1